MFGLRATHPGVVQVTYGDGSVDYVPAGVNVTNTPTAGDPVVVTTSDPAHTPVPQPTSDNVSWGNGTEPSGTTYTWETTPTTPAPGQTTTGTVKITYPNGRSTTVTVPIVNNKPAVDPATGKKVNFNPTGKTVNVKHGASLPQAKDMVDNAPSNATSVWVSQPDTNKTGLQEGTVSVTATVPVVDDSGNPTGEHVTVTKDVPVWVNVGSEADEYNPVAQNISTVLGNPVNINDVHISNLPNCSNLPRDAKVTWGLNPWVNKPGEVTGLAKVTYGDGSIQWVPVNVNVTYTAPTAGSLTTTKGTTPDLTKDTIAKGAITNLDPNSKGAGIPSGAEFADINTVKNDVKNVTTTPKDETVTVSYTNANGDIIYRENVSVPMTVNKTEADKYQPAWKDSTVEQGKTVTVDPTWQDNKKPSDAVSYQTATGTPTWISINSSTGKLTYRPTTTVAVRRYAVPVKVTYHDGSTETVNAYVVVTAPGNKVVWGSQDTCTIFSAEALGYHKTSGNSGAAIAPTHFDTIKYYNSENKESVWILSTTGSHEYYENTKWNGGAADSSKNFDASDITYLGWQTGLTGVSVPTTDVSAFDGDTGDTLYKVNGQVNPAEQTTTGQSLRGNSKWRYNFEVKSSTKAASIIGTINKMWTNVYFNFYGATPKKNIPVNVGDTVPRDASGIAKYIKDTGFTLPTGVSLRSASDSHVTGITWAPNEEPGQNGKFDASHLTGTMRLTFDDGSYLDIQPTFKTGSYVPTDNSNVNDDTNLYVTRTIKYDVSGTGHAAISSVTQTVHYVRDGYHKIDANGNDLTAVIWNAWKLAAGQTAEFPEKDVDQISGFRSKVDGTYATKVNKADVTTNNGTPQNAATVTVTYDNNTQPVPFDPSRDNMSVKRIINYIVPAGHAAIPSVTQTVNYTRKDEQGNAGYENATTGEITWNAWHVVNNGAAEFPTMNVDQISGFRSKVDGAYATKVDAAAVRTSTDGTPQNAATITVTYDNNTQPVPFNPSRDNMSVKRIIKYDVSGTGHAAIPSVTQTVNYTRKDEQGNAGYENATTGEITWNAWHVVNNGAAEFPEYNVTPITGFDSYVDGRKGTKVSAASVQVVSGTPQNGATVTITYRQKSSTPTTENFSQDIVYKLADGTKVKTVTGALTGTLTNGSATVTKDAANSKIDADMPSGYDYVSGKLNADETITSTTPNALVVTVKQHNNTPATENFSQDIVYKLADGTKVKTVTGALTGTLTNGSATVTKNVANNKIDADMPSGYDYVSGKLSADETINSQAPAALVVIVKQHNNTPTPVEDTKVTYIFHDDTDNKTVGTPVVVSGKPGTSHATGLTIPAGYKLAEGQTLPTSVVMPDSDETVLIHLVHGTTTIIPGTPGVTPTNPAYQDMFKTVTRTIIVENPLTEQEDTHKQAVQFSRSKTIDLVTNAVISYGAWTPATGTWDEFDAPVFAGYTPSQAKVAAETVTADTQDTTVVISYSSNGNPSQPGDHGTPANPGQPGDHGTPTNPGQPGDHGTPTNPGQPGDHGTPTNPGQPSGNGTPTNPGNKNGQPSTNNNGQKNTKQALPQTGDSNKASLVAGLGLAGLTTMLGLGGLKKKRD